MNTTNDLMVEKQYKTADNLNTRISIHDKYSTNKTGFGNWIISNYEISDNMKILELGCGTGDMWKDNLHLLNNGTYLTLTDFSEGMVEKAKSTLGENSHISYRVVNAENIPYEEHTFDRVIANMMLYHLSNLERGISEVHRVLKNDGYFYCATYGENGIVPFLANLLKECGVKDTTNKNFTLQNGDTILRKYFTEVRRLDYQDSLAVTDLDDILDYIYSLTCMAEVSELRRDEVKNILKKKMINGVLNIPKEYGMFICKKYHKSI